MEKKDEDFRKWISGGKTPSEFSVKKTANTFLRIVWIIVGIIIFGLFVYMLYASNYNASY
jgi:hypothetical protein